MRAGGAFPSAPFSSCGACTFSTRGIPALAAAATAAATPAASPPGNLPVLLRRLLGVAPWDCGAVEASAGGCGASGAEVSPPDDAWGAAPPSESIRAHRNASNRPRSLFGLRRGSPLCGFAGHVTDAVAGNQAPRKGFRGASLTKLNSTLLYTLVGAHTALLLMISRSLAGMLAGRSSPQLLPALCLMARSRITRGAARRKASRPPPAAARRSQCACVAPAAS